jgi:putative transposase
MYETLQRCRGVYPVQLMCRCLKVSTSGFYAWTGRSPSPRERDNQRLLKRIREHHSASDGVMGMPRMHEELTEVAETASPNRIAQIMANAWLQGIPQPLQWRRKRSGLRPTYFRNHLERDFIATAPYTKWVTDITYIYTAGGWLSLCLDIDSYGGKVIGWSMSTVQHHHLVLKSVLIACWQRPGRQPVILHSDRGTRFTSFDYENLEGPPHHLEHEPGGTLRGQRRGRGLLRHAQARQVQPAQVPHLR